MKRKGGIRQGLIRYCAGHKHTTTYKIVFKEGFVEKFKKKKISFLECKLAVCLTLVSEIVQSNHEY